MTKQKEQTPNEGLQIYFAFEHERAVWHHWMLSHTPHSLVFWIRKMTN